MNWTQENLERRLPAWFRLAAWALVLGCSPSSESPLVPSCPPGMALVSGGAFLAGASPEDLNVSPQARDLGFVPLAPDFHETGDFCMDIYEFPNIAGVVPAIQVTYADAEAACTAIGKRLCTEAEFERACGGPDGWHQPYGPDYRPGYCNNEAADVGNPRWLAPSGSFFHCVTPEGIYDLEGNLSEWVAPAINIDDPAAMPQHSPVATTKRRRMAAAAEARVVRGGTMWQAIYGRGCPARHTHPDPGPAHDDDGFRCCADPSPAARGTFRPSPEKQ